MNALEYLQNLVDQSLRYGIKSPNMDLYDFGFNNAIDVSNLHENKKSTYVLHIMCRFKVIWKKGAHRVDRYYEDTPCEKFHSEIKKLIGMKVLRVALSDKNDLWLDFGDCWVVFITFENGEESWRFFTSSIDDPHLVSSDSWLYFSD